DDTVLNLALVQDGLSDKISRGENRGRQLTHEHVVRAFRSLSVSAAKGTETVSIPKGASDLSIVAYVQHKNSWKISGATAISLSETVN
ncbi:MAG: DUF1223 domain-containing protein, partial [Bacteroidota bacterium]